MKIINIAMLISLIILFTVIFMIFSPIKIHSSVKTENEKYYINKKLSTYISKFKNKKGRLPHSIKEIRMEFKNTSPQEFSQLVEKNKTKGLVHDCSKNDISFEVQAIWFGKKNEELLWARTTSGHVIRFPKYIYK